LIDWIYKRATDVEGIFRVSGELAPTKELRELFDYDDEIELLDDDDPHVIGGALKLYLRETDNPLITRDLYNDFMALAEGPKNEVVEKLKIACEKLPEEHKWILIYLCWLLNEIRKKENVNLMTLQNIVIVFGPSVMRHPDPSGGMDFNIIALQSKVLTLILEHFTDIFGENPIANVLNQYQEHIKNNPPAPPPLPPPPPETIPTDNENQENEPEQKISLTDSTPSFVVVDYDKENSPDTEGKDKRKKKVKQ